MSIVELRNGDQDAWMLEIAHRVCQDVQRKFAAGEITFTHLMETLAEFEPVILRGGRLA